MPELNFAASPALRLHSLADAARLGRCLAKALHTVHPGALLLYGGLGAGKTTLCRFLVAALPGGDQAETSSPSFTICNIYCTKPLVHHFDLYRLTPGTCDDALADSFDTPAILTIVEWPEHIATEDFPPDGLALRLRHGSGIDERRAEFIPLGPLGREFLDQIFPLYHHNE